MIHTPDALAFSSSHYADLLSNVGSDKGYHYPCRGGYRIGLNRNTLCTCYFRAAAHFIIMDKPSRKHQTVDF